MPRGPKQITVISGKGGTGKTTVLAAFAALAENAVFADCDVDAANLHLLLHPDIRERGEFWGAQIAVRDAAKCDRNGECERVCRFDAITPDVVDPFACEGCGMCVLACPNGALTLKPILNGHYFVSDTEYGPMTHAKLLPAAESSGKLVTKVRQLAEKTAVETGRELILIDGPPGIGCTAVAAMAEVDLAVAVTEPTLSGIHDLLRVAELAGHFQIPMTVIINKADLNLANTADIHRLCAERGLSVVAELPFDEVVTRSIAAQVPIVRYTNGPVVEGITTAWQRIRDWLAAERTHSQ